MKKFQEKFDAFLMRHGVLIISAGVAFFFVLALRPVPLNVLRELSLWWFIAPALLFLLLTYLIYRRLKKEKPDNTEFVESGE